MEPTKEHSKACTQRSQCQSLWRLLDGWWWTWIWNSQSSIVTLQVPVQLRRRNPETDAGTQVSYLVVISLWLWRPLVVLTSHFFNVSPYDRLKAAQLDNIFLTRLSWQNIGGLSGEWRRVLFWLWVEQERSSLCGYFLQGWSWPWRIREYRSVSCLDLLNWWDANKTGSFWPLDVENETLPE